MHGYEQTMSSLGLWADPYAVDARPPLPRSKWCRQCIEFIDSCSDYKEALYERRTAKAYMKRAFKELSRMTVVSKQAGFAGFSCAVRRRNASGSCTFKSPAILTHRNVLYHALFGGGRKEANFWRHLMWVGFPSLITVIEEAPPEPAGKGQ